MKQEFVDLLKNILPISEANDLLDSFQMPLKSSIRLNNKKLKNLIVDHEQVKHCKEGYILKERPLFTADPGFHSGAYYVQESNSMWIGEIVRDLLKNLEPGSVILDLCAAPGGKSTHISSVLRDDDVLVANEVISSRNSILYENLSKWGNANSIITKADAKQFNLLTNTFDIICCDAPCSGEGMFRRGEFVQDEWSLANVKLCSERQQRIVIDSWNCLKPGGYFIYSTCTYNSIENEENVSLFSNLFNADLVPIDLPGLESLFEIKENTYRCLPHRTNGEGLFFAVLKKPHTNNNSEIPEFKSIINQHKNKKNSKSKEIILPFQNENWMAAEGNFGTYALKLGNWNNKQPNLIQKLPGIQHPGAFIGKIFNGDWKVDSAFDLTRANLNLNLYPTIELSDEEAIQYLKKEFLSKKIDIQGVVGLTWRNLSLGTANSVKNGLNNMWPTEWRIRMNVSFKTLLD